MRQMMSRKFERKMATGENSHRSGRGKHKRICQITAEILNDNIRGNDLVRRHTQRRQEEKVGDK